MNQVSARFWLESEPEHLAAAGDRADHQARLARDPRLPPPRLKQSAPAGSTLAARRRLILYGEDRPAAPYPPNNLKGLHVEVKIGVIHASRELTLETNQSAEESTRRSPRHSAARAASSSCTTTRAVACTCLPRSSPTWRSPARPADGSASARSPDRQARRMRTATASA